MQDHTTPRERAMYLAGQIKANRERVAQLDATLGSLTEARYAAWQQVMADEAELRSIQAAHYGSMSEEARDQAQGRAEDFRRDGSAA